MNSVSFVDGKKFNDNKSFLNKMRKVSDRLCREQGLSVIENPKPSKHQCYPQYIAERDGEYNKFTTLKKDIDECILRAGSERGFLYEMQKLGYRFDFTKPHTTVNHPSFKRPVWFNNSTQLTKSTFKSAYESRGKPSNLTFHSDRGSNYISYSYRKYLEKAGVTQSFSKSGSPYDNAVIESFFNNMKTEELYRRNYRSEKEFKAAVYAYIDFYNNNRPHKKNHNKTPIKTELDFFSKQAG